MGLNAKKIKSAGSFEKKSRAVQEALEAGSYEGRVVCVIDLGLQPQRPFQGEEKPPAHMIRVTYELSEEFVVDENGEEQENQPRWFSEEFPLRSLDSDLAKSTKRYRAIDPTDSCDGDFTALVGMPCMVVLGSYYSKKNERDINKVSDVTKITPKKAAKLPELVNPTQVFVLDEPDMEVFEEQPDWLKERITGNLEYKGSVLEGVLKGDKPEPAKEEAKEESDDEW